MVVLAGGYISPVYAADGISLEVMPKLEHIIASPGAKIQRSLKVVNQGDPVYIQIHPLPSDALQVRILAPPIIFDHPVLMQAHDQIMLPLEIDVSSTAAAQDYTQSIATQVVNLTTSAIKGINVRLSPQIYTQFIISVTPDGITDSHPRVISLTNRSGPLLTDTTEEYIDLVIENTGSHAIYVHGLVEMIKPDGSSQPFSFPDILILSHTRRHIDTFGTQDGTIRVPASSLQNGRYVVKASMGLRGTDNPTLYAQDIFFVISAHLIAFAIILSLGLFSCMVYVLVRHIDQSPWTNHRSLFSDHD